MKKVILISGHAQNGKDTFAEMLKNKLEDKGKKVVITHFAKHLKRILIDYYGWDGKTKDEYWRAKMQYLGTEKIRVGMLNPHFHVSRTCEDIQIIEDDFDYIIIPDCRFPNEVYYTKASFVNKVEDIKIGRLNFESPLTKEQQAHPSETALDGFKFSYVLINDTLKQLEETAHDFANRLVNSNDQK